MSSDRRLSARLAIGFSGTILVSAVLAACSKAPEPKVLTLEPGSPPISGPLRSTPAAPAYFSDASGKPVYLSGSHTWNTFQDWGTTDPPPQGDYEAFLDLMAQHGHNFTRFFVWEQASNVPWTAEGVWFAPLPYERTGPGLALDGKPRFDVSRFNPVFFERLRERVAEARDRGIYVSVMLFNGWSTSLRKVDVSPGIQSQGARNPWLGHPFNRDNNVNGVDGDPGNSGDGRTIHTLELPAIRQLQEAWVAKLIDTLGDLPNVVWEVCSECDVGSEDWQYSMIRYVKEYESKRPMQHPVGMSVNFPGGRNSDLFAGPADWIAPNDSKQDPYMTAPPLATTQKVVIADTDHLWGIGGHPSWLWKSVCRGLNPVYMDPDTASLIDLWPIYRTGALSESPKERQLRENAVLMRKNLGYALRYMREFNLGNARPSETVASSGYALAQPGEHYLVYVPEVDDSLRSRAAALVRHGDLDSHVQVDLSGPAVDYRVEWLNPDSGEVYDEGTVRGGRQQSLGAPFRGEAVLYLAAVGGSGRT